MSECIGLAGGLVPRHDGVHPPTPTHTRTHTAISRWSHLLTLTGGRVGPRAAEYAEAIGKKLDLDDPAGNRVIGFIDGVFV